MEHVENNWAKYARPDLGEVIRCIPAQKRNGEKWYEGDASAVFQNKHLIEKHNPSMVAIFGADHVYYMDIRQMIEEHKENGAEATVCALPIKKADCPREADGRLSFGVIDINSTGKIIGFREKPRPDEVENEFFASMGNYLFNTKSIEKTLTLRNKSFGKHILPKMLKKGNPLYIYNFTKNRVPGMDNPHEYGFWMDLGQIDDYYAANMEFINVTPRINLYNKKWRLMRPASKTVFAEGMIKEIMKGKNLRRGEALDSIVSEECIISGGTVYNSVLSREVRIGDYAIIESSILLDNVRINSSKENPTKIKNTIIDKNVIVPAGTEIGYNLDQDKTRGMHITLEGRTVIPKGYKFH
jgi:glucose-1-phosphate adenylyltransferase